MITNNFIGLSNINHAINSQNTMTKYKQFVTEFFNKYNIYNIIFGIIDGAPQELISGIFEWHNSYPCLEDAFADMTLNDALQCFNNDGVMEYRIGRCYNASTINERNTRRCVNISTLTPIDNRFHVRYTTVNEGGMSGHMKHIYDYDELTLADIKELINDMLFNKITGMTEKVDGMNIQVSMNTVGQVIFIRNKGDINSETGGMLLDDIKQKWAGNDKVLAVMSRSAEILQQLCSTVGASFFNPDAKTRRFLNCECMGAGKTNVLLYVNDNIYIHDIWTYKLSEKGWTLEGVSKDSLKTVQNTLDSIENSNIKITPNIIVTISKDTNALMEQYLRRITEIFRHNGCDNSSTVGDLRRIRWNEYIDKHAEWMDTKLRNIMYDRCVLGNKSVNMREIKKEYADRAQDIIRFETQSKQAIYYTIQPLDRFFIDFGDAVIHLCTGFINSPDAGKAAEELTKDLTDTIDKIKKSGSDELMTQLLHQLERLGEANANDAEGVVFQYKGKTMKLTGSFAVINNILNMQYKA